MGASIERLYPSGPRSSADREQAGTYVLRLFITGTNPRVTFAIERLRRFLDRELTGNYSLEVHDVLVEPQLAEEEKIMATPTLVKEFPLPERRIIGDFSEMKRISDYFGLHCEGDG